MATHSSTLAWKIPWTEEPGRLQSMGSLGVGHDWVTSVSLFTFMHWRRKWQPTPVLLPGESQGRGAWWAAVYGVAQSRIQLKRLSSSSSREYTAGSLWHRRPSFRGNEQARVLWEEQEGESGMRWKLWETRSLGQVGWHRNGKYWKVLHKGVMTFDLYLYKTI